MAYEKPELITLSLAGTAVRSIVPKDSGGTEGSDTKTASVPETGNQTDKQAGNDTRTTSSSGGAYEADE